MIICSVHVQHQKIILNLRLSRQAWRINSKKNKKKKKKMRERLTTIMNQFSNSSIVPTIIPSFNKSFILNSFFFGSFLMVYPWRIGSGEAATIIPSVKQNISIPIISHPISHCCALLPIYFSYGCTDDFHLSHE